MRPALGHCEDPECHESTRLFRCTIHCDRNLCLFHLNAHNVYYEEEKKQNTIIINELQNHLSLYQTIFEKQIIAYRELVRQTSSILLHSTSSIVPIETIQPVLEKLQQAIAIYHEEKIVIKCEPSLDTSDIENKNNNVSVEPAHKVVVRIPRIDYNTNNIQPENENSMIEKDENVIRFPENENLSPAYVAKKVVNGKKTRISGIKRLQK